VDIAVFGKYLKMSERVLLQLPGRKISPQPPPPADLNDFLTYPETLCISE
jgi:hypothetical protein